jgi:hypothetical protein
VHVPDKHRNHRQHNPLRRFPGRARLR